MAKENGMQIVAKLNGMITQGHMSARTDFDSSFEYNKDADRYICPAGVMSTKGTVERYKDKPNMCILTILTPILMMLTPSKRAGLSKSSLCLLANRQRHSRKVITFSFS